MNERKPSLKWLVVLAAILLVVLMLSAMPFLLPEPVSPEWQSPEVVTSTPTPSATPGWWDDMPTPIPLVP